MSNKQGFFGRPNWCTVESTPRMCATYARPKRVEDKCSLSSGLRLPAGNSANCLGGRYSSDSIFHRAEVEIHKWNCAVQTRTRIIVTNWGTFWVTKHPHFFYDAA